MSRSNSVRTARQARDTGFPEPFALVRNTTLPHPDADLSPNACIGQDDVHADLVMRRSTLSFLHRSKKHRKTTGHGVIPSQFAATPSVVSLTPSAGSSTLLHHPPPTLATATAAHPPPPHNGSQPSIVETPPSPTASRYVRDSFATTRRDDDDDETPPTSPDDAAASIKSTRRLFGRFRRHH
ncbi:hypothetical protein V2A60_004846 [Cordyceps javanica]|uniref:Uncharacterized protein n=1 Tax=Cordyceps javanica TaxID=43265 RepID=A0A545VCA1_9HYPO|nr:hypothetical protein IF1G_01582 [Cordyceps javanica]TQW10952.1 hypothetical protein IF2G_01894 [Cordyceps javanica]